MPALFEQLPKRFSGAALLKNFPRPTSLKIIQRFSPTDGRVKDVLFEGGGSRPDGRVLLRDEEQQAIVSPQTEASMLAIRKDLGAFFGSALGFGGIARINYVDGVRVYFSNGDVAHVRPSGNADELRIYAVADAADRADAIATSGVAEPDGILRRLERAVSVAQRG